MKTLVIYELVPEDTKLYLLDGDRSELNGLFINSTENIPAKLEEELSNAWPDREVQFPFDWGVRIDEGLIVVHCGFLL